MAVLLAASTAAAAWVLAKASWDNWEQPEAKVKKDKIGDFKFPETLGNVPDQGLGDEGEFVATPFEWNSDDYQDMRGHAIEKNITEPFIHFEFLTVPVVSTDSQSTGKESEESTSFTDKRDKTDEAGNTIGEWTDAFTEWIKSNYDGVKDFINLTSVKRRVWGSASLYMTTDIQINDTIGYEEDTRKLFGTMQETFSKNDLAQMAAGNAEKITASLLGAIGNRLSGKGGAATAIGALAGYGIGDAIANELQLKTGKITNPNEFLAYKNTPLRTFSFNFKFLPSSENESIQAWHIMKLFRTGAHAKRESATSVTVPDHVVISLHGGGNMIQIPPVVCTGVNITYNPNAVSFFEQGGEPVEIDMALTFQELVPIYQDDVIKGN